MKQFGLILIFVLGTTAAFSQFMAAMGNRRSRNQNNSDQQNKFYFGGGGGLGAGTSGGLRYNYYSIFPFAGYRITNQFSAGTGFNYQRYNYPDYNLSYTQYGVMPFVRYNFNPLFFQLEYDAINAPTIDNSTGFPESSRKWFSRLLPGLGYSSQMGKHSSINVLLMYDLLYHYPSPFSSPVVARVFFAFR